MGRIPSGAYPGVTEDIPTIAMMNWIVSREELDRDVVMRLLDILRDDRAALGQVHEMAGQIDLATLAEAPIPLHQGVVDWLGRE